MSLNPLSWGPLLNIESVLQWAVAVTSDGSTYLSEAVLSGQTEPVKTLISGGADINARRDDGKSPLNVASAEGFIDIARILLDNGADVESRDNNGFTPLYNAILRKHHDVVTLLIERRADVNTQGNSGATPLMAACFIGTLDTVNLLLKHGSQVNMSTKDGFTPLFWASFPGRITIIKRLLDAGADVNLTATNNESCLLVAALKGHSEVVRALVFAGADVNLQSNHGFSPLSAASEEGHIDCVELLIQHGAEVETRNNKGATPLYWAAMKGHTEVVQFLIYQHADVNACCSDGSSCLWTAAFTGHTAVVGALVSAGADVNLQRNDGSSPLSAASQEGHIDCVKQLIHHGAEVDTRNNKGATPLYWAATKGHIEVVQFLIYQHADVNASCNDGSSCLWTAAFNGHTDVVHALVSAGADVNLQGTDGVSPLSAASQEGHTDIVMMLLDSGADIEIRDNGGETALWVAASHGQIEVLDALISREADVNSIDYILRSPLCRAAVMGHVDVVTSLLQHKANISYKEGFCVDPLYCAALIGRHDVKRALQLLINNGASVDTAENFDDATTLMCAAYRGDLGVVNMLVECGADIHARTLDNLQAIDIAGFCGHVDIVKLLRDCHTSMNYSSMLNHTDFYSVSASYTPSSTCIDCNCNTAVHLTTNVQCMRSLLENGADIEAENVDGLRPIHYAVRTGLVELVELLIQHGANVDAADICGNRPIHEAVCHGLKVVQLLVIHEAKVNVQNVGGKTPLHIAVERQQSEVILFLLNAGADVGLTDIWRNTPLHYLSSGQLQYGAYEKCVAKQAKKYQYSLIRNAVGLTALSSMASHGIIDYANNKQQISCDTGQTTLCSEQLSHALPSSTIPCLLELQYIKAFSKTKVYCREVSASTNSDCYGNTPLHHAVGVYGHLKLYRVNTDVIKTVEFLVKRGADINAQNNDGLTPLHVARGKESIQECLQHANDQSFTIADKRRRNFWHLLFIFRNQNEIESAENIRPIMSVSDAKNNSDDLNRTPLHYACMKRNVFIAEWSWLAEEFIVEYSDEHINKQDRFGRTALHYAAMADNTKLMNLLRTKKAADDTIRDNFAKTADEYRDIFRDFKTNVGHLRLLRTSSLVARSLHSTSLCVQKCFSHRYPNLKSSKAELHKIVCDLRANNATLYVLNTYKGCRLNYFDVVRREKAALKQRFHKREELLAAEVKKSTTQPPTMFAAIQSQVEKAMQHLAREMFYMDARFACEVVSVGSAQEDTKIGCCDEFDYNFVLTGLSKRCKVCYSPESPPGFVRLKGSTPEGDEDLFNSNGTLNTSIVKFKFETLVNKILSSLSFCEATGFELVVDGVQDFSITKLNTQIKLEFAKPVNGCHVPHNISVDVVPALRIDGWWPDDMRREDLCQTGDCLIVFTQPRVKYPWIGWTEPCGFISFAQAESRLLRDSPPVIKAAFMVVKRMSKYFCQYEFFSSHVIKTALFWCLDEVEASRECSSSSYSEEINEDELLRWVQDILLRLLCFAAQDYVPSYFMPKCHQPVWLKEKYLKQFHMHLYQHGLLTYIDLFSLNEQQSRDSLLKYIKSLFICSHLMYWTVLSDDDELKLFVPSTINPLTESDVCTTLLPTD